MGEKNKPAKRSGGRLGLWSVAPVAAGMAAMMAFGASAASAAVVDSSASSTASTSESVRPADMGIYQDFDFVNNSSKNIVYLSNTTREGEDKGPVWGTVIRPGESVRYHKALYWFERRWADLAFQVEGGEMMWFSVAQTWDQAFVIGGPGNPDVGWTGEGTKDIDGSPMVVEFLDKRL